jgi:hypothetical protein
MDEADRIVLRFEDIMAGFCDGLSQRRASALDVRTHPSHLAHRIPVSF